MSLRKRSIIAVLWDFLGTFSVFGIRFVISIFLARLLSPEEFGVVAMAMVFITIFQIFTDFGFSSALIQNKENTDLHYSSIFIINLIAGISLFGFFQLIAPLVGRFYENETVVVLVRLLALSFIFYALSLVQIAILKRELRFKELNLRLVISGLIGGVIGILMALKGYGVFALVSQTLITALINILVLWKVTQWRPSLKFSWPIVKNLTGFSVFMFLSQGTGVLVRRLNILVIGKLFSASILGYFYIADNLNNIIAQLSSGSIAKVFFPVMSKFQDDKEKFKSIFLDVLSITAFITFLLSGLMILSADYIILNFFGEKWLTSIFIFQILMLKIFNFPINNIIVNSFLALGKAKENFWYGNIRKAVQLIPFVIAYFYGFYAYLYSLVVISLILTTFNIIISGLSNGISIIKQFKAIYIFGLFFIISLPSIYYLSIDINELLELIIKLILFGSFYFLLVFFMFRRFVFNLKRIIFT